MSPPGFDFTPADARAAMGHSQYLIVERNHPVTNLMISALVTYLDATDAGTGFQHSPRNPARFPQRLGTGKAGVLVT